MRVIDLIMSDIKANRKNPKGILLCCLYRIAHSCVGAPVYVKPIAWAYIAFYKILTELFLSTEIHWRARIGPGLRIFHGYGLVVNSGSTIGENCTLRHGVTIGVRETDGDGRVPMIGKNVDIGASAIILGAIVVGDGAKIGAAAVVLKDVPAGSVAVGNPARLVQRQRSIVDDQELAMGRCVQ